VRIINRDGDSFERKLKLVSNNEALTQFDTSLPKTVKKQAQGCNEKRRKESLAAIVDLKNTRIRI
jgi:hypothetical protein